MRLWQAFKQAFKAFLIDDVFVDVFVSCGDCKGLLQRSDAQVIRFVQIWPTLSARELVRHYCQRCVRNYVLYVYPPGLYFARQQHRRGWRFKQVDPSHRDHLSSEELSKLAKRSDHEDCARKHPTSGSAV